jgi:hypothetical protein
LERVKSFLYRGFTECCTYSENFIRAGNNGDKFFISLSYFTVKEVQAEFIEGSFPLAKYENTAVCECYNMLKS